MKLNEAHVISMIIQFPKDAFKITHNMPIDIFEDELFRKIFKIYKKHMLEHTTVDALTIRNELIKDGIKEDIANYWFFEHSKNIAPCFNAILINQLFEHYKYRKLQNIAYKIIDNIYDSFDEAKNDIINTIVENVTHEEFYKSISDIDINDTASMYVTGVDIIDDNLNALFGGQLVCIAGRPSMGKSSLALQIAKNMAKLNTPVYFASLETTEREILFRLIASETGIPVYKMLTDGISLNESTLINSTYKRLVEELSNFKIIRKYNLDDILYVVKHDNPNRAVLIIDYLQIMHGSRRKNRVEEIADMTRRLKLFAMERDMPIILLSQLNREADGRVPKLSDLRDSGTIEQDSDIVIFVHKEDKRSQQAQIIFAKVRDAAINYIDVYHNLTTYTFSTKEPIKTI